MKDKDIYILEQDFAGHPKDSLVVFNDGIWYIGNKKYDIRGSISQGEIALTLNYWAKSKAESILNPMDGETIYED